MAVERERKFLVDPFKLPALPVPGKLVEAGYFTQGPMAVRVTRRVNGTRAFICIKGPGTIERQEFEYQIPDEDAQALIELAPTHLSKTRFDYEGWEIDSFIGFDLWLAEWEEAPDKAQIPNPLPEWIIKEVTDDVTYTNQNIAWNRGLKCEKPKPSSSI